jgi:glycosyltransferase involved in cell wall biosynthesis
MIAAPRLLYTSFDEVPSAKGASTHIEAFAEGLGAQFGGVVLATPGPADVPPRPFAPGVQQVVLGCPDDDVLGRALTFRAKLLALVGEQAFDLIHFRSIFEGYALARHKEQIGARLLYEVNGFPSIELKYTYPRLRGDERLRAKLVHQECVCLTAADRIVTVSRLSRAFIAERGIAPDKVAVVPNGVDPSLFAYHEPPVPDAGPLRLLYVGTLSTWQGVEVLLAAVRRVQAVRPVELRLIGPTPRGRRAVVERLARRLGLEGAVFLAGSCERRQLVAELHRAHAAVVPLLPVDRNLLQGCCPLKMLEALAAGCPVIASDLPVVREIATPEAHFVPVEAGRTESLAAAILRLDAEPELGRRLARQARAHVLASLTWEHANRRLHDLYLQLLG